MNAREQLMVLRRQTEPDRQRTLGADMHTQVRFMIESAPNHTDLSQLHPTEQQEYRSLWQNLKVRLTRLLPGELAAQVDLLIDLTPRRVMGLHVKAATQAGVALIGGIVLLHLVPVPQLVEVLAPPLAALMGYLGTWSSEAQPYTHAARALNARVTASGVAWPEQVPLRPAMVNRRA